MDLVTAVAACAIGLRSELFIPLGLRGDCARAAAISAEPMQGQHAAAIDRWATEIAAASLRFGVPERILRAVMRAESGGKPNTTSPAGAMGLMQLMPETWAAMRAQYRLGANPYAPADNIMAGAAFLRELIDRYGVPDFLAAYNAGPVRLDDHRQHGRPLPDETRRYVAQLAPIAQDVASGGALPTSSTQNVDRLPTVVARPKSDRRTGNAASGDTAAGLFAMNEAAGARRLVLTNASPARTVDAVLPRTSRPKARDGGAIFAPIGAGAAGLSAPTFAFRTE